MKKLNTNFHTFDYIVIGTGIAGLSAALELSRRGKTAIISKQSVKSGSTHYAQGGIAVAMAKEDAPSYHLNDTLEAGAGLCDPEVVKILVEEGPERVKALIELGTQFDKAGKDYALGQEGAHHKRRILHAKDATGREIERALGQALLKHENVSLFQNVTVTRLLSHQHRIVGCVGLSDDGPLYFQAPAIVLATGGCGQIFSHSTNPPGITGDGISLAWDIGCEVQDMEFIQFHPTTLHMGDKRPISIFLISEAVRGEGALLRNSRGERFMKRYHPMLELAPRDVVSRSIVEECKATGSDHVFLDLTNIKGDVAKKFPTIYERCLKAKIDIKTTFIPVSPAAHFLMGGIKVSPWGETSVSGLFACGEVACMGIHGANRLASNSLLDGLVFGHRTAQKMAAMCLQNTLQKSTFEAVVLETQEKQIIEPSDSSTKQESSLHTPSETKKKNEQLESVKPAFSEWQSTLIAIKHQIRELMWEYGGIYRDDRGLKTAISHIDDWEKKVLHLYEASIYYEVKNMMTVSRLVLMFARKRTESRGGHFRVDFSDKNDEDWLVHQTLKKGGRLKKVALDAPSLHK